MNMFSKIKNARIKATSAMMVAGTAAIAAMPAAFADVTFGNLWTNLGLAFTNAYAGFKTIANPIAMCCGGFCLIMMFTSKDQKKMEGYKQWLIGIVVCLVVLNALGGILTVAQNFGANLNLGA